MGCLCVRMISVRTTGVRPTDVCQTALCPLDVFFNNCSIFIPSDPKGQERPPKGAISRVLPKLYSIDTKLTCQDVDRIWA